MSNKNIDISNEETPPPETIPDGSGSALNTTFKLPTYILKNLTPLKRSHSSNFKDSLSPIDRKREQINSRREKIRNRQRNINKRVLCLKVQRKLELNKKLRNLNRSLEIAKERRNKYLSAVREKACSFRKNIDASNASNNSSYKLYEFHSEMPFRFSISSEISNSPIKGTSEPQTSFTSQELVKVVNILKETNFLNLFDDITLNKCIQLLQNDTSEKSSIITILIHLGMPDLSKNEYSTFLYAFIMMCDFRDSLENNLHPGFNSNTEYTQENLFNNFIWLLLYKFSNELITTFQKIVYGDISKVFLQKENLLKIWMHYHFLFRIFKVNHFKNVNYILNQSIEIVNKQLDITNNDLEILQQKDNLLTEKSILNKYEKSNFQLDLNWDENNFVNSIRASLSTVSLPASFSFQVFDYQFNFEGVSFISPPMVPKLQWGKYWFTKFLRESKVNRAYPAQIISGFRKFFSFEADDVSKILKESFNYHEFGDLLGLDEFTAAKHLKNVLNEDFFHSIEFFKLYQGFSKNERFHEMLIKYGEINQIDVSNFTNLRFYLIRYCELLLELYSVKGNEGLGSLPIVCYGILCESELNYDNLAILLQNYSEFKASITAVWINRCRFTSFQSFRNYENSRIYAYHNTSIRSTIFTNSPHLKFPLFYKLLSSCNYSLNIKDYLQVLEGSINLPDIFNGNFNKRSYDFFRFIFFTSIVEDKLEPNELNDIYLDDFTRHNRALNNLLDANAALIIINSFYSDKGNLAKKVFPFHLKPSAMFQVMYRSFERHEVFSVDQRLTSLLELFQTDLEVINNNTSFFTYFKNTLPTIRHLLMTKFTKLFFLSGCEEFDKILFGNFRYCYENVKEILKEISHIIIYIYKLHCPILNWIYKDIGEASF